MLDEPVRRALSAWHDPRQVVADPSALYFGIKVGERTLVPHDGAPLGTVRLEDWLATARVARPAAA